MFFNRLWEIRDRSFEQQRWGQRPQPGDGGYRAVEHGVHERATQGLVEAGKAGGRRAAAIPVAAGLGHQKTGDAYLAAEPQTGRQEVSALTDARKTLAYDFFRILRAPLKRNTRIWMSISAMFICA